ncbi:MAG: hypothetical protein OXC30_06765 [Alphaproteobacteria bacterium]|nr:hypothetical protein [Alphaproteobacteria bacterium]
MFLLIMVVFNARTAASSPWDDEKRIDDGFVCRKNRVRPSRTISPYSRETRIRMEVGKACRAAQKIDSMDVEVVQQKVPCFHSNVQFDLDYNFLPETEIAAHITQFLDIGRFPVVDTDDMGHYKLREWLSKAFVLNSRQKELITYPFMAEEDSCKYVLQIQAVMKRLHGIFCWDLQKSHTMPEWEKEEKYPKIKKILLSWKQGPFPESFCENIIFLMQNRARLEFVGCEMHFIDDCVQFLPNGIDISLTGAPKYRDFYKNVLEDVSVFCKEKAIEFEGTGECCEDRENYVLYYVFPLKKIEEFVETEVKHPAAVWLCDLAYKLMNAEIILGKRPELVISIQGIAAYINDQLEYVQFHPRYAGMNTATLNALVMLIAGEQIDFGRIPNQVLESLVVNTLHQKPYGLKWGIHKLVVDAGWLPTHYTRDTNQFLKTKVALGALKRFGVSSEAVRSLQLSMDRIGMIPTSLYHDPLTERALTDFLDASLRRCRTRPVVCAPMLTAMQKTVDCIVHDMKLTWQESAAVDYKNYQEIFSSDRALTKDDLVALEGVIGADDLEIKFELNVPFFQSVCLVSDDQPFPQPCVVFQHPLLLAVRAHIGGVFNEMVDERQDILEVIEDLKSLAAQLELLDSGQVVMREVAKDVGEMNDKIIGEAHGCKTEEEKKQALLGCIKRIPYTKKTLTREISDLKNQCKNRYEEFQRKKEILEYFCTRLYDQSRDCLIYQPVNMIVMFLKSLGVVMSDLAHTVQEARDVAAVIIDERPLQRDGSIYYCNFCENLKSLSLASVAGFLE